MKLRKEGIKSIRVLGKMTGTALVIKKRFLMMRMLTMRIQVQDTMSRMVQRSGGMRVILVTGKMRLQTGTVTLQMKMKMRMRMRIQVQDNDQNGTEEWRDEGYSCDREDETADRNSNTADEKMKMKMRMRIQVQDTMSRMVQRSGGIRVIFVTGKMRLQTGTVTMQMRM